MAETVPARDPEMVSLHHADWLSSRAELRARAVVRAMENEAAAMQAHAVMKSTMERAARVMDISLSGPSDAEIARARHEMTFGKGRNEEPFRSVLDPLPLDPAEDADSAEESEPPSALDHPIATGVEDGRPKPAARQKSLKDRYANWRGTGNVMED